MNRDGFKFSDAKATFKLPSTNCFLDCIKVTITILFVLVSFLYIYFYIYVKAAMLKRFLIQILWNFVFPLFESRSNEARVTLININIVCWYALRHQSWAQTCFYTELGWWGSLQMIMIKKWTNTENNVNVICYSCGNNTQPALAGQHTVMYQQATERESLNLVIFLISIDW